VEHLKRRPTLVRNVEQRRHATTATFASFGTTIAGRRSTTAQIVGFADGEKVLGRTIRIAR
jgi:hypothetical protein